jgi:WD40 repeat protein
LLTAWDVATGENLFVLPLTDAVYAQPVFSPDGKALAVAAESRIYLLDAATGKEVGVLAHGGDDQTVLAFSADGSRIVVRGNNGVRIHDVAARKEITNAFVRPHQTPTSLRLESGNRQAAGFRSDGSQAVILADNRIISVDLPSRKTHTELTGLSGWVNSVAFSADGTQLATGSADNSICIWNAVSGEHITVLKGHTDEVSSVTFSPVGSSLASGSKDGTVRIWSLHTGCQESRLDVEGKRVCSVAFCADGRQIAAGCDDRQVRVWEVSSGREALVLAADERPQGETRVASSPDGRFLATVALHGSTIVWNAVTGEKILTLNNNGVAVAFSPDSSRLATLGKVFQVWTVPEGDECAEGTDLVNTHFSFATTGNLLAFSPDGSRIAVCQPRRGEGKAQVRFVRMDTMDFCGGLCWGISTGSHRDNVTNVAFSPDGRQVATGSLDGTVRLWGRSGVDIRHAQMQAKAIRERLKPHVDSWFALGPNNAVQRMLKARSTFSTDECREAAHMVLQRCVASRPQQP